MAAGCRQACSALTMLAIGWLVGLLSVACAGPTVPATVDPAELTRDRSEFYAANGLCLFCHSQGGLTERLADGQQRTMAAVEPQVFDASAHGWLRCVECHATQSALPHPRLSGQEQQGPSATTLCPACHGDAYEGYLENPHGTMVKLGDERAPTCSDCHGIHDVQAVQEWTSDDRVQVCAGCHAGANIAFLDALTAGHEEPSLGFLATAFFAGRFLVILTALVLAFGIIHVELNVLRWLFGRRRTSTGGRNDADEP